jgi:hypothetical protein
MSRPVRSLNRRCWACNCCRFITWSGSGGDHSIFAGQTCAPAVISLWSPPSHACILPAVITISSPLVNNFDWALITFYTAGILLHPAMILCFHNIYWEEAYSTYNHQIHTSCLRTNFINVWKYWIVKRNDKILWICVGANQLFVRKTDDNLFFTHWLYVIWDTRWLLSLGKTWWYDSRH